MRALLALLLMLPIAAGAQLFGGEDRDGGRARPAETQVTLPQFPTEESYLPFEVGASAAFDFFVDAKSISVAADRVVRYTVIAKSKGGAVNISFEGMRCAEREYRIYAFGRADKTWSEARNSRWEPILGAGRNPQRAALFRDYFCPVSRDVASAEEAVRVLKSGGNPQTTSGD